ncbi:DUF2207 domain-containing protein [Paenibacillus sp. CN-4]|uniref:DUF2207 domain-containing protein n=1 Tax=Paenibacillus nanchangensis TaxID=3348343 RepID=UPI00397CAF0A
MIKSLRPVMLWTAGLLLAVLLGGCGGKNEYTIGQAEIVAELLPDGDLYVEELYTYSVKGEYDSFTRFMDNFGDANIEFFEAYAPPQDRELGNFGYKELERYPVTSSKKRGEYYAKVKAKDETKQVYYRYRLDQEAVKYSDGGELDWIALQENDVDIHNVTVTLYTRQEAGEPLAAYAYDRSEGSVIEQTNQRVRYKNDLLREGDQVRLKAFLPAEILPDMESAESPAPLNERLAQEKALVQRYMDRERLLETGLELSLWLTYITAAVVVFYALSLRRIFAWLRGRPIAPEELEEMDPVRLVYLYRKGKLRRPDVLAGVMALRRKGKMEVLAQPSDSRFQQDPAAPKRFPQFVWKGGASGIQPADRYVQKWLFRRKGVLNLNHIAGPTRTERRRNASTRQYLSRLRMFEKSLARWQELVDADAAQSITYSEYKLKKGIFSVLTFTHLVLLVYLYYADAVSWTWTAILAAVLAGGAVLASVRSRHKGFITAFLIFCFFAGAQIGSPPVVDAYLYFVLLSLLLVALLPGRVADSHSDAYRSAIKRYRRRLANGGDDIKGDPVRLERNMEAALALGVGRRFLKRVKRKKAESLFYSASPLFDPEMLAAIDYAFNRSWKGVADKSSSSSSGSGGGGDSGYDSSDYGSDGGGDSGGGDGGGGGGD